MENDLKSGSNLEKILKAGHFAFTGELGPPRGETWPKCGTRPHP